MVSASNHSPHRGTVESITFLIENHKSRDQSVDSS